MPQSFAQIYLHIIYSTKNRRPDLQDKPLREELHRIVGGICNSLDCPVIRVGGIEDHIHIACCLGRTIEVADLIKETKRQSSIWLKTKAPDLRDFHWQNGYGAFSISPGHVPNLIKYLADQEEHHRHESFQDEYRRIMRTYGIEWDERYVWD